ncbi:MAG: hypothetical protein ABL903_06530 [Methylococcales bacterium]
MRFLPLPKGTLPVVIIAVVLLLTGLIWGSYKHTEALWAPGNLSRFHADTQSCNDCHQPFRGTTAVKCIACHDLKRFAVHSRPEVAEFHSQSIRQGKTCNACHTEHQGALAQITVGAMVNPHGEFVFRATGTHTCSACHDFTAGFALRPTLLDNAIVKHLREEGDGAHKPGKMTDCLKCHQSGRLEIEEDD